MRLFGKVDVIISDSPIKIASYYITKYGTVLNTWFIEQSKRLDDMTYIQEVMESIGDRIIEMDDATILSAAALAREKLGVVHCCMPLDFPGDEHTRLTVGSCPSVNSIVINLQNKSDVLSVMLDERGRKRLRELLDAAEAESDR